MTIGDVKVSIVVLLGVDVGGVELAGGGVFEVRVARDVSEEGVSEGSSGVGDGSGVGVGVGEGVDGGRGEEDGGGGVEVGVGVVSGSSGVSEGSAEAADPLADCLLLSTANCSTPLTSRADDTAMSASRTNRSHDLPMVTSMAMDMGGV